MTLFYPEILEILFRPDIIYLKLFTGAAAYVGSNVCMSPMLDDAF